MLKIKVKATPDKGKANKPVIKILEKTLTLPKGSVNIDSELILCLEIRNITVDNDSIINKKLAQILNNKSQFYFITYIE